MKAIAVAARRSALEVVWLLISLIGLGEPAIGG
jgi:hypothetical protein